MAFWFHFFGPMTLNGAMPSELRFVNTWVPTKILENA
jgi:hypothetical protein